MTIPVPNLRRWTPVLLGVRHWQESSKRLQHFEAQIAARPVRGCRASGQILWTGDVDASRVGVAWSWARRHDGIVVMVNPMSVISNLALLDDDSGEPLSASQQLCCLNCAIFELPWRTLV